MASKGFQRCISLYLGLMEVSTSGRRFQPWFRPWTQLVAVSHGPCFAFYYEYGTFSKEKEKLLKLQTKSLLALSSFVPAVLSSKNDSDDSKGGCEKTEDPWR